MFKMFSCLLLLTALLLTPSAPQEQTKTVDQRLVDLNERLTLLGGIVRDWEIREKFEEVGETQALILDFQGEAEEREVELKDILEEVVAEAVGIKAQLSATQNLTSQLLTDLQVLKGRQVVSGGVQGVQVFMFVSYLITICILCVVKHCNKHRESVAQEEFELLEARLAASKAKRRAAAARASKQSPQ